MLGIHFGRVCKAAAGLRRGALARALGAGGGGSGGGGNHALK